MRGGLVSDSVGGGIAHDCCDGGEALKWTPLGPDLGSELSAASCYHIQRTENLASGAIEMARE